MISEGLKEILEVIKSEGTARLLAQGHTASGDGIASLRTQVEEIQKNYKGQMFGEHYLLAQETGIKSDRYKISKNLITNLTEWLRKKTFAKSFTQKNGRVLDISSNKSLRSIAYAIAKTHKIKGMHTRDGNYAPQYQGWLSETINENEQKIKDTILKSAKSEFEILINTMIKEANRNKGK